jgi:hypothetical protein
MTPKTAALLADPPPKTHIVYPYSNFDQIAPAAARFSEEEMTRGDSVVLMVTAEMGAAVRHGGASALRDRICRVPIHDLPLN